MKLGSFRNFAFGGLPPLCGPGFHANPTTPSIHEPPYHARIIPKSRRTREPEWDPYPCATNCLMSPRHINFVYSVALRLVGGDARAVEDVTQTVFIALARKSRTLFRGVMLGGRLRGSTLNHASE